MSSSKSVKCGQKITLCFLHGRAFSKESERKLLIAINAIPTGAITFYMCNTILFHNASFLQRN